MFSNDPYSFFALHFLSNHVSPFTLPITSAIFNFISQQATPFNKVLLVKLMIPQMTKKYPAFYVIRSSSTYLQETATAPFPERVQFTLQRHSLIL